MDKNRKHGRECDCFYCHGVEYKRIDDFPEEKQQEWKALTVTCRSEGEGHLHAGSKEEEIIKQEDLNGGSLLMGVFYAFLLEVILFDLGGVTYLLVRSFM